MWQEKGTAGRPVSKGSPAEPPAFWSNGAIAVRRGLRKMPRATACSGVGDASVGMPAHGPPAESARPLPAGSSACSSWRRDEDALPWFPRSAGQVQHAESGPMPTWYATRLTAPNVKGQRDFPVGGQLSH